MANKTEDKVRYFKLGKNAYNFLCPNTQLSMTNQSIGKLTLKSSKFIDNALRHGHIKEVKKEDYDKWLESTEVKDNQALKQSSVTKDISSMTGDELIHYYKESYDVSGDDVKTFSKMTKKEKVEFLSVSEEESEHGDDE